MLDKTKLVDSRNRPITQSLFLEIGYKTEFAVYTLKSNDYEYKGKVYPSLKRLYMESEDLIGIIFAQEHLLDWDHWERLKANKLIKPHADKWQKELELLTRARSVKGIIDMTADEKAFQACKWIADKGWDKRAAGRPSESEKKMNDAIDKAVMDEFEGDVVRLFANE